ncbi:hypothetical protein D3C81_2179480 [compost metagenome]
MDDDKNDENPGHQMVPGTDREAAPEEEGHPSKQLAEEGFRLRLEIQIEPGKHRHNGAAAHQHQIGELRQRVMSGIVRLAVFH